MSERLLSFAYTSHYMRTNQNKSPNIEILKENAWKIAFDFRTKSCSDLWMLPEVLLQANFSERK